MRRIWTFLPAMRSVATRIGGALLLCAAPASAEPIVFSSGGGMGYYYEAFLVGTEPAGPEGRHRAVVRLVANDGSVSEGEWSVDCSRGSPRTTRPDGSDILVDLAEGPSSATFTDHELWWAVCAGELRKLSSDHADPAAGVEPEGSGSFRALDATFGFKVLPAGKAAVVPSLATVRISEAAKSGFKGREAVVFCSTEPTVFWKRSGLMVQLGWTELADRQEQGIGEISTALHQAVCGSSREAKLQASEASDLSGPAASSMASQ